MATQQDLQWVNVYSPAVLRWGIDAQNRHAIAGSRWPQWSLVVISGLSRLHCARNDPDAGFCSKGQRGQVRNRFGDNPPKPKKVSLSVCHLPNTTLHDFVCLEYSALNDKGDAKKLVLFGGASIFFLRFPAITLWLNCLDTLRGAFCWIYRPIVANDIESLDYPLRTYDAFDSNEPYFDLIYIRSVKSLIQNALRLGSLGRHGGRPRHCRRIVSRRHSRRSPRFFAAHDGADAHDQGRDERGYHVL